MRIDLLHVTEPQHTAALFKCANDRIERVGLGKISIELDGVRHLGE